MIFGGRKGLSGLGLGRLLRLVDKEGGVVYLGFGMAVYTYYLTVY